MLRHKKKKTVLYSMITQNKLHANYILTIEGVTVVHIKI